MRELNTNEVNQVTGGMDFALIGGFAAGMQGLSFSNTIKYSAIWGAALGSVIGLAQHGLIGAIICTPGVAVFEAGMGWLGYSVGTYFKAPDAAILSTQ